MEPLIDLLKRYQEADASYRRIEVQRFSCRKDISEFLNQWSEAVFPLLVRVGNDEYAIVDVGDGGEEILEHEISIHFRRPV